MSIKKFSQTLAKDKILKGNKYFSPVYTPWVRPADWPTLPTLVDGDQKFVGLHAVYQEGGNFVALSAAGNYTIDWGDGVVENFGADVISYHEYDFTNVNLSAVTSKGYKCAVVTLTMQSGQTFSSLKLHQKHNKPNLQTYASGFLDIAIAGQSLSVLTIGVQTAGISTQIINFRNLEKVNIIGTNANLTNMSYMFSYCNSLQEVSSFDTSAVTNMSYMFNNCYSLQKVSLFDTSAVTIMSDMFNGCNSLQEVPSFNTSAVSTMSYMFYNCYSLQEVPLFNTSAVTIMSYMFNNCYSLQEVPLFNTSAVTNMTSMFNNCYSLQEVPLFNTSAVTNMTSMFSYCNSLQKVSLFNTSAVTNMTSMFYGCYSLQEVPLFNTSAVTNMNSMFSSCNSLQKVSLFNTSAVTNMSYMFSYCHSLLEVPSFNTSAVTNMTNMFDNCYSLQEVSLLDTSAVTTMSYMFSYCYSLQKVPLFNTSAVTNMSYMFRSCSSLQKVPLFNTSAVTTMSNMFSYCYSLVGLNFSNLYVSLSVSSCRLSRESINNLINSTRRVTSVQTLTISSNWGLDSIYSKSVTATSGSKVLTAADTSGLAIGMQVTGTGIGNTTAIACTFTDSGDLVNKTAHGLDNGTMVSFSTITTTTGILTHTLYYVVNATTDTFQVSATLGGAAINLVTNGSGNLKYAAKIVSIDPNVSVTLDTPATSSGSSSRSFREIQTQTALLQNWTVTG